MFRGQTGHLKKRFLAGFLRHGTITAGAKYAKIHRQRVYDWEKSDATFKRELEQAKDMVADSLEQVAIRRAKAGSDTMLIFLLKGYRPEVFRESTEHIVKGAGGQPITIRVIYGDGDSG